MHRLTTAHNRTTPPVHTLLAQIEELTTQLDTAHVQTQKYKLQRDRLEIQVELISQQLHQEQKECKTRHLNYEKYKGKNEKLKLRVIELQSQLLKSMSFQGNKENEDRNQRKQESCEQELDSHRKKEVSRLEEALRREKEISLKKEEQIQDMDRQKHKIINTNEKTLSEFQLNLEGILSKVKLLEQENDQLRLSHFSLLEELKESQDQLADLTSQRDTRLKKPYMRTICSREDSLDSSY